jgi:putative membrane protein
MFHMHDIGWGWWLFMSIGMLAAWALLVYGFVWLMRGERPQQRQDPAEDAEQILKRRLAAGEITIDEYEHLRDALDEKPREPIAA